MQSYALAVAPRLPGVALWFSRGCSGVLAVVLRLPVTLGCASAAGQMPSDPRESSPGARKTSACSAALPADDLSLPTLCSAFIAVLPGLYLTAHAQQSDFQAQQSPVPAESGQVSMPMARPVIIT
mmetsp:Transcript_152196/g.265298  ORF Transcript_152196/g.265298 Transcript_152196/m.265298 type:complete len:125 (-) Transcript_152196:242-616(-)